MKSFHFKFPVRCPARPAVPSATLVPALFTGLLACLFTGGCVLDKPWIHPQFHEINPRKLLVTPVVNRTLLDLSSVTSTGALQSLILKGAGVDVPGVIRQALMDALEEKGYQVQVNDPAQGKLDYHKPLPEGETSEFDGVVYSDITRWAQAAISAGGDVEISGMVEIVRAGDAGRKGGTVLFRKNYIYRTNFSQRGVRTTNDLLNEVRRAGLRSIRELPPCGEVRESSRH